MIFGMYSGFFVLFALIKLAMSAISDDAIDISRYQTNPNFKKVVDSGIRTIIHKATQGVDYIDRTYESRKKAASEAGVRYWGAYHFADGEDGYEQAKFFVKTAGRASFYAVDLEDNPTKNRTTVSLKQAEDLVRGVLSLTGRLPFIYGGAYFLDKWNHSDILSKCPLWVASWRETPIIPKMWDHWVLWQYTDGTSGPNPVSVPGIGKCDRDKVDIAKFHKYIDEIGVQQLL